MESADYIALVLVYLIIIVSLAASKILEKKSSKIDTRKVVHIGVGNFVFVWWMFSEPWIMEVFFAVPFTIILFFAMFKNTAVGRSDLGDLARNKGHKTGLFLYALSIVILVALCFGEHWTAASIGIVAMTYGDGFGSIIGKRFGKHKLINGKSFEGSFSVFAVTVVVSLVVVAFYGYLASQGLYSGSVDGIIPGWAACLLAGALTSIIELVTPGELDNLLNALLVAGAMVLLGL